MFFLTDQQLYFLLTFQRVDLSTPTSLPGPEPQADGLQLRCGADPGTEEPVPWSGQVRLLYDGLLLLPFMTSAFRLYFNESDVEHLI